MHASDSLILTIYLIYFMFCNHKFTYIINKIVGCYLLCPQIYTVKIVKLSISQAKNSSTKLTSEQLVNDKMNKKRTAAITTSTSGIFGDKDSFINASKYSTKQLFDKTKESNNMLKITRTKSKADHAKYDHLISFI